MKSILVLLALVPAFAMAASYDTNVSMGQALTADYTSPSQKAGDPHQLPADHPCVKLNLTDAQKASIKDLMYNTAEKGIQAEADLKKAFLTWGHTFMSATSTKDQGTAAQAAVMTAAMAAGQIEADMTLAITYDILQPEQRENAMMCAMAMRRAHQNHGEHGHGGSHP